MLYFAQVRSWTRRLLFAGSLLLGCGDPRLIQPQEPVCTTATCEEEPSEEPEVAEPEKICPEGKDGDVYWRLADGTLGDLAEECAEDQTCIGGLCAKIGMFSYISNRNEVPEIFLQEGFLPPEKKFSLPNSSPRSPKWCFEDNLVLELTHGSFSELYQLDMQGTLSKLTLFPGYNSNPSCDDHGQFIFFSSNMNAFYNIYKIEINSTEGAKGLVGLTRLPEADEEGIVAFSESHACRTGDWVAVRCDYEDNSEICKISKDGTILTRLTFSQSGGNSSPACSPDGTKIAFTSYRHDTELGQSNKDIYVISINGGDEQRITSDAEIEENPAWSPDGKIIGYELGNGGEKDLWITDNLGKEHLLLTSKQGDEYDMAWKQ